MDEYDNQRNTLEEDYKRTLASFNVISERLENAMHNLDISQSGRSVIPKVNARIDESRQRIRFLLNQNRDKIDTLKREYRQKLDQLEAEYEESREK
jgi:hypothetical protein